MDELDVLTEALGLQSATEPTGLIGCMVVGIQCRIVTLCSGVYVTTDLAIEELRPILLIERCKSSKTTIPWTPLADTHG